MVLDIPILYRALDKREYLVISRDNFCKFCIKTLVVTPHFNRLIKMVQMRSSHHMVSMRNKKNYHQMLPFIKGPALTH